MPISVSVRGFRARGTGLALTLRNRGRLCACAGPVSRFHRKSTAISLLVPMRLFLVLSALLLLCACTSVSEIRADANRQYSVSAATRNPFISWRTLTNAGRRHAEAFCARRNEAARTVNAGAFGVRGAGAREADVRFECGPHW